MSFLVHVSSTESREIHAFQMDASTGRLMPLEAVEVPGTGAPTRGNIPMTWGQDRKVLYAQVRTAPFPLSAFAMDPESGRLNLLGSIDMPAPIAYLSTTRNGKFLLGASYDGALLTVNAIAEDGRPSSTCQQTIATPPKAHCIIEAPFGGYVYATSVDGEVIQAYRLNQVSGRLSPADPYTTPTRAGSGPRHLVFHPTLGRLYCTNEHEGSLSCYSADPASGELQGLQHESLMPPDFSGNARAADLHCTPDGRHIYASVRATHSIIAFRIDPHTGAMSNAGSFQVEASPRGFAIVPNGRFLVCAGQKDNQIAVYNIHTDTGALSLVDRYAVGKQPGWIEIIPTPKNMRP